MLSNYVNAGITDVGVIVHQSYQSLLDHVGSGKDWDLSRKHGGLRILPPSAMRSGEASTGATWTPWPVWPTIWRISARTM